MTHPASLLDEEVIALGTAAHLFPGCRGAGRVNPSTTYRWCTIGCRTPAGVVKLESFRAGSRVYTTRQAVARFVTALSAPAEPADVPAPRTPDARRRAADAAAQALIDAGV